jgi:hypothetical protein
MNTQDETGRANDCEENDDRKPAPTEADKKEVNTKKASKRKGAKHKYIPTVWMEGGKMIKRGKAVLQQSNDEISQTLRNKDKAKRNKELKIRTDNEVRSGAQTTLANFVSVKVDKHQQNKTQTNSKQNAAMDNEHNVKGGGDVQDQSSEDEEHFWDSEVVINVMNECKKFVPVDWSASMMLDPDYVNSLEKKELKP